MLSFKLYQKFKIIYLIINIFLRNNIKGSEFVFLYDDSWKNIRDNFDKEELEKEEDYQNNKQIFNGLLRIIDSWYLSSDSFEGNLDIFNKNHITNKELQLEIKENLEDFEQYLLLLDKFYS